MSCSRIFSGDLPELTYEVIKYFKTDFSTLHSCILVNRLWCRLAIPLLWENPFSGSVFTENYNFIEIYLDNLNDDSKTKLSEYKINDNLLPSNTLFNYSKFIKYLNIREFISSVGGWSCSTLKFGDRHSDFICVSLFKIFVENEIELHVLDIEIPSYYSSCLDKILEFILQNTNFIQNIKNLNLYINNHSDEMEILIAQIH
uniref:F-box domain-containing protein n=1 Tax=Rhizophagus irregularis (strain DAOM 181602 / DAOM 197198 / MUCL 43194) TaxID=747089 RepID=U9U216_RHIID